MYAPAINPASTSGPLGQPAGAPSADEPASEAGTAEAVTSLDALADEIRRRAALINAATARWLGLVAEFDRRQGHERWGFTCCATWLAWQCGLEHRAAREQVRVARSLAELPGVRSAFEAGRISYSKVRALSRVAEPDMEAELLELAGDATAAQLERLLGAYRRAVSDEEAQDLLERRHLNTRWEEDGSLTIRGSLPPEEGAMLLKALERSRERLAADSADPAGGSRSPAPYPDAADALVAIADADLDADSTGGTRGDRNQLIVHVDADAGITEAIPGTPLTGTLAEGKGRALASATTERLACDASVVTLVEREGVPLSVGRKRRTIPPSIRRALASRDRCCRFPGCERTSFVDAHHIEHWAHGGETSLENLIQLCRHHHRLVHEGGFSVRRRGEEVVFRRPDGRVVEVPAGSALGACATSDPGPAQGRSLGTDDPFDALGLADSAQVPSPQGGGRMDLDLAVFALASRRSRRLDGLGDLDARSRPTDDPARAGPLLIASL